MPLLLALLLLVPPTFAQEDRTPPRILNVRLQNQKLRAGDRVSILVRVVDEDSGVQTNSGVGAWLGSIVQNVFPLGEFANRSLEHVEDDIYRVSDLVVNPWVVRNHEQFTIVEFSLLDRAGNRASLAAPSPTSQFYRDQTGALTQIRVMRFEVAENPAGDMNGPMIRGLRTTKKVYQPGERLVFEYAASDGGSGLPTVNAFAGVLSVPNILGAHGPLLRSQPLGNGVYRTEGVPLVELLTEAHQGKVLVQSFSILDRARNWGYLRLNNPTDPFYLDHRGNLTQVRAVSFEIAAP